MKLNKALSAVVLVFMGILLCVPAHAQRTATATPTVVNGFVVAITVTDGGAGYSNAPSVTISGGGGSGATATATVTNGSVIKVIVGNAGNGYTNTPTVVIAAPPSPKPPFSDGLVAYYPFNGNANDESGNGNNGVVAGATLKADRFGTANRAFVFDGASYISMGDVHILDNTETFSASAWFKLDRLQADWAQLMSDGSYGDLNGWGLLINSTQMHVRSGNVNWAADGYYLFETNTWYHSAFVLSSNSLLFYINGSILSRQTNWLHSTATLNTARSFKIGKGDPISNGFEYWFHGSIDDVRIYNRALSEQEVQDLYYYEAPEQPLLIIKVKTVQITMIVKPTIKYQLKASLDLKTWTNVGDPFVASTSAITQEFNAVEVGRYFQLVEVQ